MSGKLYIEVGATHRMDAFMLWNTFCQGAPCSAYPRQAIIANDVSRSPTRTSPEPGFLASFYRYHQDQFLLPLLKPLHMAQPANTKPGCTFCGAHERPDQFKIVYEDELLVAFEDIRPAAKHHVLVCPKHHVESVKALTKEDIPLLQAMQKAGSEILDGHETPSDERRMGFHIPPIVAISHLHLHVQALPYNSRFHSAFSGSTRPAPVGEGEGTQYHKGFGWFLEIDQMIAILEAGKAVGIWWC